MQTSTFARISVQHTSKASREVLSRAARNNLRGGSAGLTDHAEIGLCAEYQEGWFLWVPSDPCSLIPDDLEAIFSKCRDQDLDYVLIDRDFDPIETLPILWEG